MPVQKNWKQKFKISLEANKIYFDTIAATLLSLMAIIISCFQINTTLKQNSIMHKQTELMDTQTKIAKKQLILTDLQLKLNEQQYKNEINTNILQVEQSKLQNNFTKIQTRLAVIQDKSRRLEIVSKRRADFIALKDLFFDIFIVNKLMDDKANNKFSSNEIREYYQNILNTLNKIGKNPILLEDTDSYFIWSQARFSAQMLSNSQLDSKIHYEFINKHHSEIYKAMKHLDERLLRNKEILKWLLPVEEQKNTTIE